MSNKTNKKQYGCRTFMKGLSVIILSLLFPCMIVAQDRTPTAIIESQVSDFKFNEVTNKLEFTVSLRAGTAYYFDNGGTEASRDVTGMFFCFYLNTVDATYPDITGATLASVVTVTKIDNLGINTVTAAPLTPPTGNLQGFAVNLTRKSQLEGNFDDLSKTEFTPIFKVEVAVTGTPTAATITPIEWTLANQATTRTSRWSCATYSFQELRYTAPTYSLESDKECPPAATWTGAANDRNWDNVANWDVNLVPGKCTYVTIPGGISNYPELTAAMNAKCGTIYFKFGGEVAHTWLLDYDDAKVDMTIEDNRWYMVAPPLRDMYSGDYFLDDSYARLNPSVYMMKYQATNPETQVAQSQGNWSNPFNTLHVDLPVASGFAVWVDEGNKASGNWTFAFPKDSTNYLYYDYSGRQTGRQVIDDLPGGMVRTNNMRFTWESANPVSGAFSVTPSGDVSGYNSQIVGNPFMSHLDLNKFYEANKTEITNTFYLWTADESFSAYKKVGELFMIAGENPLGLETPTSTVPPMQSFFVEKMSPSFPIGALNFTPDMETTLPGDVLKSTASGELKNNILKLDVYRDGNFQSGIAIRYAPDAQNGYADVEDSWTLFPDKSIYSAILYSLIEGKAATINSLGDLSQDIELGIATPVKSSLKLVCRNEENFDSNCDIFLIDRMEGSMQNLRKNPEYEFVNATGNVEGRFALRIVNNANSIKNPTAGDISIYVQNDEIFVNGSKLQTVEVFNLQGQIIARKDNINANQVSIMVSEELPLVIVKAYDENGIANKKLRIK